MSLHLFGREFAFDLAQLGRFGTPEEMASTVLHLSAPGAAFIVGTEIIVDGGMSQL